MRRTISSATPPSASWRSSQGSSTALSTAAISSSSFVRSVRSANGTAVWAVSSRRAMPPRATCAACWRPSARSFSARNTPNGVANTFRRSSGAPPANVCACISAGWCGTTTGAWISVCGARFRPRRSICRSTCIPATWAVRWGCSRGGRTTGGPWRRSPRRCARSTPTTPCGTTSRCSARGSTDF